MHHEISKKRFNELNKVISYLESRNNIITREWSNMEGMIQGIEVRCKKTKFLICLLYINNKKKTYFFKEIFEKKEE
jgi:hypothetical protein